MGQSIGGRASVFPAGTFPPSEPPLDKGVVTLTLGKCVPYGTLVDDEAECGQEEIKEQLGHYVTVTYPDGFVRDHQVTGVEALVSKIVNNLRARHGTEEVKVVSAPAEVKEGEIIELEV